MFGNDQTTGKPANSDLREGKLTVLALKTFELATPTKRRRFEALFGNDEIDAAELAAAREIITSSGAKKYVQNLAQTYADRALEYMAQTTMNQIGKQRLADAVRLLTDRTT
jgi:geranylgeranyl diphosphate synthase type I